MSAERRADAIAETIETLGWCVTIPHTIDQVIGIYAERTATTSRPMRSGLTNDEILSRLTGGSSGGGKGGHSDPTAQAALWGQPDAVDDDETVANIRAAVTLCHETAVEIGHICADALGSPHWCPPAPLTLTQTVAGTLAHIHRWTPSTGHTAANLHGEELAHFDTLIRVALAETATWLHDKAQSIYDPKALPAVQRTIVACRVHERWVKNPPNAVGVKDLCGRCETFQERYRCEPTEPIVRRWEYGSEATPGQILEAKAASRKAKRKAG